MRRIAVLLFAAALTSCASAPRALPPDPASPARGTVHLDVVHSKALGVDKRVAVYLPPSYDREPARRYPVVVYLHGLYGSENDWLGKGGLDETADSLARAGNGEAIIVMPDGDDGWWTSWAIESSYESCADTLHTEDPARYCVRRHHYDDWVTQDVIAWVDATYRTRADRAHRGVAGLSMGGFAAISLALQEPTVFGAAASHSGLVSMLYAGPHPFAAPARYTNAMDSLQAPTPSFRGRLLTVLGPALSQWRAHDPATLAQTLKSRGGPMPALYLDCGREDSLLDENRAFDWELTRLGIPHTYSEWPGAHSWRYWHDHSGQSLAWLLAQVEAK